MEGAPEHPGVDELVARLKAKVEEREREGYYPTELAHDLQEHFRRVATHRSSYDRDALRQAVEALERAAPLSPDRIVLDSGMPGGRALHRLVARLAARQTQGVLAQVQEFAEGARQVLRLMVGALEEPQGHFHADLVGQVDALFEHVASFERGPVDSAAALADVRHRLEALEAAERDRGFRPFFSTARLHDVLDRDRDESVAGYEGLAKRFADCAPVLDLGSGRGDFLEALLRAGVEARGVEGDLELVDGCLERGLHVEHGAPLDVLLGLPSGGLGGVSLVQAAERLTPQQVIDVVSAAADKLRPGGCFVVEAVNPQSLYAYAHVVARDPRSRHTVHPEYLAFVVREAGFADIDVEWRAHPADGDVPMATGGDRGADVPDRVQDVLLAPPRYALVATR